MLADEELIGVLPRIDEINVKQWKDIGWYTDEKGYKRYGVLSDKKPNVNVNWNSIYDKSRIRSSNPMYN